MTVLLKCGCENGETHFVVIMLKSLIIHLFQEMLKTFILKSFQTFFYIRWSFALAQFPASSGYWCCYFLFFFLKKKICWCSDQKKTLKPTLEPGNAVVYQGLLSFPMSERERETGESRRGREEERGRGDMLNDWWVVIQTLNFSSPKDLIFILTLQMNYIG